MKAFENTTAVAIAFSDNLRGAYSRAVVSWAVAIADRSLGWTGTAEKGGRKVVLKKFRERHGYRKDDDGNHVLNDKGNKVKVSAVFDVLSLADDLCQWLVVDRGHLIALDEAARGDDPAVLVEAVEVFTLLLAQLAGGEDKADVTAWLDTQMNMRNGKPPVAVPVADTVASMAEPGKLAGVGFGEVMAWLSQNRAELSNGQIANLYSFAKETMEQRREELASDLAGIVEEAAAA